MCDGRSSILHYGPLIENRNLQSVCPGAEWECPSALAKHNNPSPLRQTAKHKDEPANTECWGVGCYNTVKRQKTDPDSDSDLE